MAVRGGAYGYHGYGDYGGPGSYGGLGAFSVGIPMRIGNGSAVLSVGGGGIGSLLGTGYR